jgi:hypothetical protein
MIRDEFTQYKAGGKVKSRVNEAGNYTKPSESEKQIFERIKAGGKGGNPGQWSCQKSPNACLSSTKRQAAGTVIKIADVRLKTIPFSPAFKHGQDCLVMQDGSLYLWVTQNVLEDEA